MKIWLQIMDGTGRHSESTIKTMESIRDIMHRYHSTYSYGVKFDHETGRDQFEFTFDLNEKFEGSKVCYNEVFDVIITDAIVNRSKSKIFNFYFKMYTGMLQSEQNRFVESVAGKLHKSLTGNMDYVDTNILVHYHTIKEAMQFPDTPEAVLAIDLSKCEATSDEKIREIIQIVADSMIELCN